MAGFQTNAGAISQEMVIKVGAAAGRVALIQQEYALQAEAETGTEQREQLADKVRGAAERAIGEEGLSVQEYNLVLTAAETDKDLENQLLNAARKVL